MYLLHDILTLLDYLYPTLLGVAGFIAMRAYIRTGIKAYRWIAAFGFVWFFGTMLTFHAYNLWNYFVDGSYWYGDHAGFDWFIHSIHAMKGLAGICLIVGIRKLFIWHRSEQR